MFVHLPNGRKNSVSDVQMYRQTVIASFPANTWKNGSACALFLTHVVPTSQVNESQIEDRNSLSKQHSAVLECTFKLLLISVIYNRTQQNEKEKSINPSRRGELSTPTTNHQPFLDYLHRLFCTYNCDLERTYLYHTHNNSNN